jgi:hypothetical protein
MSLDTEFQRDPLVFATAYGIFPTANILRDPKTGKKLVHGRFTLQLNPDCRGGGTALKGVVMLEHVENEEDGGLECYWVSYEETKSKRCMLGTEADYMFTAAMDGCSFGVGSPTSDGHVLVGHANAADVGERAAEQAKSRGLEAALASAWARAVQAGAQRRMLRKKMPRPPTVFGPSGYKFIDHLGIDEEDAPNWTSGATVFGVREEGVWKFYAQRRAHRIVGGLMIVRDVIRIG